MKIIIGGARGSSPVTNPACQLYGGETTSFLLEGDEGSQLLLDTGTGVFLLNNHLREHPAEQPLGILLTHYHLDHIAGLASLQSLYAPSQAVALFGPAHEGEGPEEILRRIWTSPYWPNGFSQWTASFSFGLARDEAFDFQGWRISSCGLHHFEGARAYRVEERSTGQGLVFATDVDWGASSDDEKAAFHSLCSEGGPPDLLIFDGHFTEEEYRDHAGWGHSSVQHAMEVAEETRSARLLVTHHAPTHSDATLMEIERGVHQRNANWGLARGGTEIELG